MVAATAELWFNRGMLKSEAIERLGGTVSTAAMLIGVTYQAVDKWPDELPPRIADRVQAALWRMHHPAGRPCLDVAGPSQPAQAGADTEAA